MVLDAPPGPRGQPDDPPAGTSGRGVGLDNKPPSTKPVRAWSVRVRSLRTQQRAESQCQVLTPFVGFFGLIDSAICRVAVLGLVSNIYGEFDPGSGRTLAACLTHASRTVNSLRWGISGERVSNTWATCPRLWDNSKKLGLIPDISADRMVGGGKGFRLGMGPRPISLLVG